MKAQKFSIFHLLIFFVVAALVVACSQSENSEHNEADHTEETEMLTLPELAPAALDGEPLRVVATTSIIGDVVAQVGGAAIQLTTLIAPGQDPHSYQPAARDLTVVADAHVILVNGWNLEEGLARDLENIAGEVPIIAVSAGITPHTAGGDEHEDEHAEEHKDDDDQDHDHDHGGVDPHVWIEIDSVEQWVTNIERVLTDLDPANADTYKRNADTYRRELSELAAYTTAQLAQIPAENRILVTSHDSLSYFAEAYDFTVLGAVIPAASTLAEPSASDLAALIREMEEAGVCAIFTETTLSDSLAQTVAAELETCTNVQVIPLYTGAIGPVGSGADSYVGMFRTNIDAIVSGLTAGK